ncbi:Phage antitermination protein Q [Sodalis glossinidius str. 'morsitans']|uniref:Phage antitermination protein Q n=1 Tax=Sodalis glossinidius (strain morsitans) TaxID=343509 RepID=A0A193QJ17_SODGM|nr:antiterminator Q family protein [Sodalis glossinidius]CRL45179.1 Phage antitermination protein Q [Sodalis glossinidius str. 'morsitans']
MRDIKYVLESWGARVVNSNDSPIAKSLSGLIPHKIKSRKRCSDDDGICISNCIVSLYEKN